MSQGFQCQLGIDTSNPVTVGFEYQRYGLGVTQDIVDATGTRGTRRHRTERGVAGQIEVGGPIAFQPGPLDLRKLIPWAGFTESGGGPYTYVPADALTSRYVTHDDVVKVRTYDGVVVNRMTLAGERGGIVTLTLDLIGKSETVANAGTFPAVTPNAEQPFHFADATLSLDGTSVNIDRFALVIDNQVEASFYNSRTAVRILPRDRIVTLETATPYTSTEQAFYGAHDADDPRDAVLTLTNGGQSLTITLPFLQWGRRTPAIEGKQEIKLPFAFQAMGDGTDPELTMVLDTTA